MSIDDERREVAERLREYVGESSVLTWGEVLSIVMGRAVEDPMDRIVLRIADLIDPTCEEIEELEPDGVGAPPRYTSRCSACGQLWDETDGIPRAPRYCPSCGCRVI